MKSKTLTHYLEFGDALLYIVVADTLSLAAREANKHCSFLVVVPDEPAGALMYGDTGEYLVLFTYEELDLPTITHELNHVTIRALERMGIRLSSDSEEVFCYYNQMLMQICITWLVESKIRYLPYSGYEAKRRKHQILLNPSIPPETLARAEKAVANVMDRRTETAA